MVLFALKITNEVQSAKRKAQSEWEASLPNIINFLLQLFLNNSHYFGLKYLE